MICPACGHENPDTARFCRRCGASLEPQVKCPACGGWCRPGDLFCMACGAPVGNAATAPPPRPATAPSEPTSFCDGRYQVKKFLGEGGKKRVYLCRDAKLERDVAFSLIKTEGLDAEG